MYGSMIIQLCVPLLLFAGSKTVYENLLIFVIFARPVLQQHILWICDGVWKAATFKADTKGAVEKEPTP